MKIFRYGLNKLFIVFLINVVNCLSATPVLQPHSLLNQTWKKYSQSGEEAVIDQILQKLDIQNGVFVEFGATDGIFLSNTRFLAERGWRGALIECNGHFIPDLKRNTASFPEVFCVHEFVSTSSYETYGKTLDEILDSYFPDEEIDVLSIDVDGFDYLIFDNLKRLPKIVCIESSGYWHPFLNEIIPEEIAGLSLGQPLSVMIDIAKKKGYEPVCFLTVNLFLVRRDLYSQFSNIINDPITLWGESWRHMEKNGPIDQQYITNRRREFLLRSYDAYPTPSPNANELLNY